MHKIIWTILKKLPNKNLIFRLRASYLKKFFSFEIGKNVKIGKNFNFKNNIGISLEDDVSMGNNVTLKKENALEKTNLHIGSGTLILSNVLLDCADDLKIGKNSHIGRRAIIYTHYHDHKNNILPPARQEIKTKPVSLGDGTILYEDVIIMPGVSINNYSIIGIRSVVTKSIDEEGAVAAGAPAKIVGTRFEN